MKNFFEHQDVARKNTFRLVVLFGLAVLLTVACVYAVALLAMEGHAMWGAYKSVKVGHDAGYPPVGWWDPKAFFFAFVATVCLIGGGTFLKIRQLARGGGSLVCEELGGRFVDFRTTDLHEQQLINIVEEMSIASGVSVPLLYVLDNERGINAFAAGFTPNNAAIAVSRGCLKLLNRDELQGVIAHEFSHILNGDMRMNIRMIGILHGILMLALTGRILMRFAFSGSNRRSRSSRDSGGAAIWLAAVGLALFIIGYVGRFFGQIIKSAISRQREFLADASAVQFTRNPKGIGGALAKIGGYSAGSRIHSPNAEQVSHLFFGDALDKSSWLRSIFATHPPLKERIRRVDPGFSGAFPKVELTQNEQRELATEAPQWEIPTGAAGGARARQAMSGLAADGGSPQPPTPMTPSSGRRIKANASAVVGSMGQTSQEHVDYARGALAAIPDDIRQAARDTYSAAGVVFAMLIDEDPAVRRQQLELLAKELTSGLAEETRRFMYLLENLDPAFRLPLVEILVPALRRMSQGQYGKFADILDALIQADDEVTLFEFSLKKLLEHRLDDNFSGGGSRVAQYYALTPLRDDIILLLSCLAYASDEQLSGVEIAFGEGIRCLKNASVAKNAGLLGKASCSFEQLDGVLTRLSHATNAIKQQVVSAAAHCVLADEEVTVEEAELLRAVCEVIDVPLPPFLPGLGA